MTVKIIQVENPVYYRKQVISNSSNTLPNAYYSEDCITKAEPLIHWTNDKRYGSLLKHELGIQGINRIPITKVW